ncbi:hypothetical protein MBLNU13_g08323t2 [Cladosporium sp. NU13]
MSGPPGAHYVSGAYTHLLDYKYGFRLLQQYHLILDTALEAELLQKRTLTLPNKMLCFTLILSTITALATLVNGSGYTAPEWSLTNQNQSALFGYQLVGSRLYNTSEVCKNVSVASHGVWNGHVNPTYVQRAFCDQVGWDLGSWLQYEGITSNIRFFNTGTFLSQLLYAFDSSQFLNVTMGSNITVPINPYTHLCAYLQPDYLEAFNIDSVRVRTALCAASNLTLVPPAPSNTSALNDTLLDTYNEYVSTLFSYLLISSSTTTSEADELCFMARDGEPGVENTGMKGSVVYNVACGRDGRRLSENEAGFAMQRWTTKVFLLALDNASDEGAWRAWLCATLSAKAMRVTGLDGAGVMEELLPVHLDPGRDPGSNIRICGTTPAEIALKLSHELFKAFTVFSEMTLQPILMLEGEDSARTSSSSLAAVNDHMHRTLPPIDENWITKPCGNPDGIRYILPPIRDSEPSSLLVTSSDKATTQFTLFPQLIPELRLMVWQHALPMLRGKLLYPYRKGCWVFEDIGLEQDSNGDNLYIRFDTTRLKPLRIALPLYSVNREARDVTIKWLQKHRTTISRTRRSCVHKASRRFRPQHDTMFLPSTKLKRFAMELARRPFKRDMLNRHFSSSNPALPRLAVTSVGLQLLKGDLLDMFFESAGTINTIFVVDDASVSSLQALEASGGKVVVELPDRPAARVKWSFLEGVGEVSGNDEQARARLKEYVEGFEISSFTPDGFELEVQLVNLA